MTQKLNSFKWYVLGHRFSIASIFCMIIHLYASVLWPFIKTSQVTSQLASFYKPDVSESITITVKSDVKNSYEPIKPQKDSFEISRASSKRFSPSLSYITNISSRKETFVKNLLPAILVHNEQVLSDRKYLLELKKLKDSGKFLSTEQNRWLKQLALKYKFDRVTFSDLLKRVDVIPPSLALGQAVVETGWGGSIAAQRFNSPFGMMKTARMVYTYESLQESVSHYIHNLNTHPAYMSMRTIRADLRSSGDKLCSLKLVHGIGRYSEIGHAYISRVKKIIESFKLQHYDKAKLESSYQKL
ncbi:MAG: glucosaminidase domain-containing protein [Janthinobacterium lividum]